MNLNKHKRIFNAISSIYNLFYHHQLETYSKILNDNLRLLELPDHGRILDIGCGTGAFAGSFSLKGYDVSGVDIAEKMIKYAQKRGINSQYGNVVDGLDFPDKSFDLVISAYVAHGLDREKRIQLFMESARLSKGLVLFHDYNTSRNIVINVIEYMEDGDYFNFIKNGLEEMTKVFSKVTVININKFNNWYLCAP
ncbi:MAG: class I SAM-dependent methyltransferase [Spirochaetaceae bacterium]|jgi:SAM-dependent methyltransferase|nr:class I SAM-dependent methyltransferase [Spirochaetaceae bacterium]